MDVKHSLAEVVFSVAKECYGVNEDKTAPRDPAAWERFVAWEKLPPFAVARQLGFAPDALATPDGLELEPWVKCEVRPLLDEPLRDPWICRAPTGEYLLCGTEAVVATNGSPDFRNQLRIRLWRSSDCVQWQSLGTVWDIGDPETSRWPQRVANAWTRWSRFDGQGVARGIRMPRLHYLKGTYWLTFSLCEQGSAILRSLTGKSEGPYEHAGLVAGRRPEDLYNESDAPPRKKTTRLTTRSGTPALFEDVDGRVYAVWDEGWIAPMDEDLAALAGPPQLLRVEAESPIGDYPLTCGQRGASLYRIHGKYVLVAEDVNPRLGGNPCHDTFCAVADALMGPYSRRRLLVPHGGIACLFADEEGRWNAACAGHPEDRFARCPNRATIVPLFWDRTLERPYRRLWCVTEAGPVSTLKPVLDASNGQPIEIRDPQVLLASDGNYYVAGTHRKDANGIAGVRLWRSPDLQRWEPVLSPQGDPFLWRVTHSQWAAKLAHHKHLDAPECRQWGAQPFEHNGTFYIPFMTWPLSQTGILRSVSGGPEGPYEETGFVFKDGAPHLFRDEDGQVWIYFCFGPTRLAPLNADLSGFAGELRDVTYLNDHQQGFEGSWILKFAGKYVLFQSDWWGEDKDQQQAASSQGGCSYGFDRYGTYDWMYSVSDHIRGPYGPPRLAVPHGGTCSVFQDKTGQFQASVFCSDSTAPFFCSLGFVPLDIREMNGDIIINVKGNSR